MKEMINLFSVETDIKIGLNEYGFVIIHVFHLYFSCEKLQSCSGIFCKTEYDSLKDAGIKKANTL